MHRRSSPGLAGLLIATATATARLPGELTTPVPDDQGAQASDAFRPAEAFSDTFAALRDRSGVNSEPRDMQAVPPEECPRRLGERPASPRSLRICAGLAVAALSLAASMPAQMGQSVAIGRSVPLRAIATPTKSDARYQLSQFGLRPTLVVVPCRSKFDKKVPKSYLKRLTRLDRLADKWRRAGGEVVCLDPRGVVRLSKDKRKDAEVLRRGRLKKVFCTAIADDPLEFVLESNVQEQHLFQPFEDEPVFRWVLLGEPGRITKSGGDVFASDVQAMLGTLEAPSLATDKRTRKGFDAINEWRLGDAQRAIARLSEEHADAARRLQQLLDRAVARHQQDHCAPLAERGLLVEHAEELERLAAAADPRTELGRKFTVDLDALRASPEFDRAAAHRDLRNRMLARLTATEDAVDKAYDKVAVRFDGYNDKAYNQLVVDNYPTAIADVAAYVRDNRASPYHREVALLLMEFKEDLQYARSVVAGGQ